MPIYSRKPNIEGQEMTCLVWKGNVVQHFFNSINTESYLSKSKQASGFSFFFFRPLTHPVKTCCLCGNPIWWLHYQEIGVTIATWCTSVHDIITDTIVPIYASGKTIQILLLFLFLPVPVPASDFKPALHKMPSAKWQLKKKRERFYNSKWHREY